MKEKKDKGKGEGGGKRRINKKGEKQEEICKLGRFLPAQAILPLCKDFSKHCSRLSSLLVASALSNITVLKLDLGNGHSLKQFAHISVSSSGAGLLGSREPGSLDSGE